MEGAIIILAIIINYHNQIMIRLQRVQGPELDPAVDPAVDLFTWHLALHSSILASGKSL